MAYRVRVYWNLHRKQFSIMDAQTNRVIEHSDYVVIDSPTFVVRPAGNRKVREQGKKNVHAFVVGSMQDGLMKILCTDTNYAKVGVTYNPYIDTTFVEKGDDRTPIHNARQVIMTHNGVFPTVVAWK